LHALCPFPQKYFLKILQSTGKYDKITKSLHLYKDTSLKRNKYRKAVIINMATIKFQSREKTLGATKLSLIAADENGNALSKGTFQFTTSSYCDTSVKTMLAQGIETPVEHRRGGNVRTMFQFMHAAAVEEGMAVALLHPFSFTYYNKFGYEKVASHLILRFPTRMIDFVPRGCNFIPYEASMLPDLISIYQAFSKGRNLLLPRVDGEKYQGKTIYVCYDGGTPIAYVILSEHKELYVNNYRNTLLTVNEMAYVSPKGLREIFSFLRMFEGEFDEIELLDGGLYSEVDLLLRHYAVAAAAGLRCAAAGTGGASLPA